MPDDLKKTGPADDKRINVNQEHEVRYWTTTLGCSEEELRAAVRAVGVMVVAVRKHLRQ